MTDLPDPLTPPECDLRGYEYMPLFGTRFFGSRLYTRALRNPRAGLAAVKLWWTAWQQCPAGSLPDDDDDLAMLADFGADTKGWKNVRDVALHGFVKCSDGRLYHPILCAEARDAFERRRKERERKARLRSKKDETPGGQNEDVPTTVPRDRDRDITRNSASVSGECPAEVPRPVMVEDRTGQDRTIGGLASSRAEARPRRSATPDPVDVPDWIPTEPWNAWLAMRRQKRAPATPEAIRLSIRELERFRANGHDPETVLNQSIQRGWTGLFEPKGDFNAARPGQDPRGRFAVYDDIAAARGYDA